LCTILFSFFKNKYLEKYLFIICGIYLICIAGLRASDIGIDTTTYYNAFYNELPNDIYNIYENGTAIAFWAYAYMIKRLTNSYQILLFCDAVISVGLIMRYIYGKSKNCWLSLLFYVTCGFYAIGLHLIKQYLAMSIIIYSIDYIINRKKKGFFFCVFLAALIHPAAILFLPAYFIAYREISIKNNIIYLIFSVICFALGKYILTLISALLFNGLYGTLYSLDNDSETGQMMFLVYLIVLAFLLIKKNHILLIDSNNIIYYNFLWIIIAIQSFSYYFAIASRVTYFYSITLVSFIPSLLYSIDNKYCRRLLTILFCITCLYAYYTKFYNLNDIYPYKFFFE
jgi:hypothetical protein